MKTPTISEMTRAYVEAAVIERMKCGRPCENTVRNTMAGVRMFREWLNGRRIRLGYPSISSDEDFPLVSVIKLPLMQKYLGDMLKHGIKPVTAISYVNQLQQLFAKWMLPYYVNRGWRIPEFPALGCRLRTQRYNRPDDAILHLLKKWYHALSMLDGQSSGPVRMFCGRRRLVTQYEIWFAATMMLEFAMRNSDISRLSSENFIMRDGRYYLTYTPHKTACSSGRVVRWPIHEDIWSRLTVSGILNLPIADADTFAALNRQMRALGFRGTKGAYELRKICIDHVYQKFGAEMAVSISGDNIKTIMHYYADTAQPNIGDVRVTDLL